MIISYSPKTDAHKHEGFYITEGKDNIRISSTGKAYSIFVSDTSKITFRGKDGKDTTFTGKELINKLF